MHIRVIYYSTKTMFIAKLYSNKAHTYHIAMLMNAGKDLRELNDGKPQSFPESRCSQCYL